MAAIVEAFARRCETMSVDDAQPARCHRRFGLWQVDDELGAVRRKQVLADEYGAALGVGRHALATQYGRPGRHPE